MVECLVASLRFKALTINTTPFLSADWKCALFQENATPTDNFF